MHKKWIGTSWKMNKTLSQAREFAKVLANAQSNNAFQKFVIPPFTTIREVKSLLSKTTVLVGAQNMHWEEHGAWTGEISAAMLLDCGADMVELGHSERREHFSETNTTVGLKVLSAMKNGLIPLICIGETADQLDNGQARQVLESQVLGALNKVKYMNFSSPILFAYEPVWAIGDGGRPASADYADQRHSEIITLASELMGKPVPCLYGGSVNPENCVDLITCKHIDGLFIGRSAWDVYGYLDILERCGAAIEQGE